MGSEIPPQDLIDQIISISKKIKDETILLLGDEKHFFESKKIQYIITKDNITLDDPPLLSIRRKKQSLESVLTFEDVIFRNDSIWSVLSMEKEEQIDHFQEYIVELKRKEKESKEQKDFYKHIIYLIEHKNKIKEMGENSLLYSKFFTSEYVINKLIKFIELKA